MKRLKFLCAPCIALVLFVALTQTGLANKSTEPLSTRAPVVVLDPGHSSKDVRVIDVYTGLVDHDYPNHPEMEEMFRVAKAVGAKLTRKGYVVIYTKKTETDTVSLRDRATIAKKARADLGVSVHDDHSRQFLSFGQVTPQVVGQWRLYYLPEPRVGQRTAWRNGL